MRQIVLLALLAGAAMIAAFYPDKIGAGFALFGIFAWYAWFDH